MYKALHKLTLRCVLCAGNLNANANANANTNAVSIFGHHDLDLAATQ